MLVVLLSMLAGDVHADDRDESKEARTEFTPAPLVGGNSDIGFGGGAIASIARIVPGFDPYLYRFELSTTTTLKSERGSLIVPYQDDYLLVALPHLLGDRLKLELRVSYTRETTQKYYGIGNAASLADDRSLNDAIYEYDRTHAAVGAEGTLRLSGPLALELWVSYVRNWLDVAPGTKLADDALRGSPTVRSLITTLEPRGTVTFTYGHVARFETRARRRHSARRRAIVRAASGRGVVAGRTSHRRLRGRGPYVLRPSPAARGGEGVRPRRSAPAIIPGRSRKTACSRRRMWSTRAPPEAGDSLTTAMRLPTSHVLVTVGTPCTISAVGTTETHRALVAKSEAAIGFCAFDAGLVDVDLERSTAAEPRFVHAEGPRRGEPIRVDEIESTWGERLRSAMGIRRLSHERLAPHLASDIAAPLPYDLEEGGLRRASGLTFSDVRHSALMDLFGLFDDDGRLGPSLQSQLFLYGGLGALAALPRPLSELLPNPQRFRVAGASAFFGQESFESLRLGMQPKHETVADKKNDKLAYRLASTLNTHGPALIATMLAPAFNLSRVRRNPELLSELRTALSPMRRVPQAPLVTSAACASALVSFCDAASAALFRYPGHVPAEVLLWTAADAALQPDTRLIEAFGLGAMMSQEKLDALNAGRSPDERRAASDCLAPFDLDAQGTVVGNAGSGVLVTTLEFALAHFLDITSVVVGWGQSGETGGKGHFAGVGFGGENASIVALQMGSEAHGYGLTDFGHVVAHATGTRTNSRTDLAAAHAARLAAAELQGFKGRLPELSVGAPKAIGDGHSMGETGLKAVSEAIHYLCGEPTVGIPTLRRVDPELGEPAEFFRLSCEPVAGNEDGGVLVPTQGFGGFNGAVALRAANADALRRYEGDEKVLAAYLERWREIRGERLEREARLRRTRGFVRLLAEQHRWPGI